MSKFLNTTTKTVIWFKKANDNGDLIMKPPFQRNPVWTHPQKSYLIDSILNGFPIPEIYMQMSVNENMKEQHIIIDGQQRIRACLEFLEGEYEIKGEESPSWHGMKFDDLSAENKKTILGYTFIVRTLPDMSDEDIRGIFQRLNKNVVALNAQELRQATYWGPFIKTMQELSNYSYWNTTGIFTPLNTRRMMDVEYISELAIAVLHGHQNKKDTLDYYYQEYEEEFEAKDELISVFQKVIYELEQMYPDIKNTRWRKKTDYYSLFIYFAKKYASLPLDAEKRTAIRHMLDDFSKKIDHYIRTNDLLNEPDTESSPIGLDVVMDYAKSLRASTDLGNRKRRDTALSKILDDIFCTQDRQHILPPITPLKEEIFNGGGGDDDE